MFVSKIVENFKLLLNPVIINAFTFYDGDGRVKPENWGDDINYFFLREIIKSPIVLYNRTALAFRLKLTNYLVIGSTIDMLCKSNTVVWGAGIIDGNASLTVKPKKVYAVRGPLTRQKLISEGVECPEVYGDPALLIPLYYQPQVIKRYKYGIIAHVSNRDRLKDMKLDGKPLLMNSEVLIIDLGNYHNWHDIVNQICSCEAILSSSLHGLIMAEAYSIPNVWIEFGIPLIGGHFKFHDFFLSIKRDRAIPVSIIGIDFPIRVIEKELCIWKQGDINVLPLLSSCPFRLKTF